MIDPIRTGKMIARLRLEAGWTQAQLADRVCVTHQAVSKWENGTALPDVQTLLSMSALFGVSMETLLTGQEYAAPSPAPQPEREETAQPTEEAPTPLPENAPAASSQAVNWDNIIALAPFLPKETLAALAERLGDAPDMKVLKGLAPFLPGDVLAGLAERMAAEPQREERGARTIDWRAFAQTVTYVKREDILEIVRRTDTAPDARTLFSIAPYIPPEGLSELCARLGDDLPWKTLVDIASHLGKKGLTDYFERTDRVPDAKTLSILSPWLTSEMLKKLTIKQMESASSPRGAQDGDVHVDLGSFGGTELGKRISDAIRQAMSGMQKAAEHFGKSLDREIRVDFNASKGGGDADSLIDEEDWDALLPQFDRLSEEQRDALIRGLVDDERWDELFPLFDRLSEGQRGALIRGRVDDERWEELVALFDRLSEDQRSALIRGLVDDERWDELLSMFDRLSEGQRSALIRGLVDDERWDDLLPLFDRLDGVLRSRVLKGFADDEQWDHLVALYPHLNEEECSFALRSLIENGDWERVKPLL